MRRKLMIHFMLFQREYIKVSQEVDEWIAKDIPGPLLFFS